MKKLLTEERWGGRARGACARYKILITPKRLQIAQKCFYAKRCARDGEF